MEMSVIDRVFALEQRTSRLETRLAALEEGRRLPPAEPVPQRSFAPPVSPTPPQPPPDPARARPEPPPAGSAPLGREPAARPSAPSLEDLLGGRVLAWAGALSLFAGLLFLLVIAVSRDWIGEEARTALAAGASVLLVAVGAHAYERRGRTDSALAATATGIAGLFASVVVATQAYELIPVVAGLALAFAVAAIATWLAIRWEARGIATLGILGAVAAPILVGAGLASVSVAFLVVATGSAVAVVVWQRWPWLALAAFALATPQWLGWLFLEPHETWSVVATLIAFGVLGAVAAVGFELRTRSDTLDISSHLLLLLNALVLAWAGWSSLSEIGGDTAAHLWLAGLAVAHLVISAAGWRLERVSHELVLAAAALGVVLADIALATAFDGLPVVAGWAVTGVALAVLARGMADRVDREFALAGLGAHLGLSLGHVLIYDAPLDGATAGYDLAAGPALALVATGCFVSARLTRDAGLDPLARAALHAIGLVVVAYLASVLLDGPALTLAWAVEAAVLAELARRQRDDVALVGAFGFLILASVHAITFVAPLDALVNGVEDPLGALALLAIAGAALALARVPGVDPLALCAVAGSTALYVASVEVVTAFPAQQGQALLSGMWALVGVAVLVAGLVRDRRELRIGALALLALTLAKVGLYDLSSLDSLYRVASFVALGALLLLGAFAWQRLRPTAPPDLRDVPPAIR
jgi:uncharacterized membrane protein